MTPPLNEAPQLLSKSVDVCSHVIKDVPQELGSLTEAIQCDLCIHVSCEGLTNINS